MTGTSSGSAKITSLEGLRGLMSFWVLLGHVSLAFGWRLGLLDRNTLAVDVFIMLSGFVIARLIGRRPESYRHYILRRGFRLFPLYLLTLLAATLLLPLQVEAWTAVSALSSQNIERLSLANEAITHLPGHLLSHLVLAHGLIPDSVLPHAPYTLLGQAWSISLEWQFYLLAPLLMASIARPRWRMLGAAVIAALLLTAHGMTNAYLGNRIELFLAGMASSLAFERREQSRQWLLFAVACGAFAVWRQGLLQVVPLLMWFAVILTVAISHLPLLRLGHRLLSARVFAHLGEISYSIYLIHMFPLMIGIWVASRAGFSLHALPTQLTIMAFTVGASIALAEASWRWLEQPAIALGNRLVAQARSHEPLPHSI
jgi:peptidoglycan/LPS O-acetylase OafA/YrhL